MNTKFTKLSFTLVLALLFQIVNAQEEASSNSIVLGGSLIFLSQTNSYPLSGLNTISGIGGIYSNSTQQTKNLFFSISPYIGKELNKNWLLGLQIDYQVATYQIEDLAVFGQINPVDFERKSNLIGIGIIGRYLINPEKRFRFYLQPYVNYNILQEEEFQDLISFQEEEATYLKLGLGAGVLYSINDRWRVGLSIGGVNYVTGKWEIVDTETTNNFSSFATNFNLSNIRFGLELTL